MDRISFVEPSERGSRAPTPWSVVTTHSNITLSSMHTFSSSNTVPGIGALTGKGIHILGKATLRGLEYLIIRRRLSVITAKLSQATTALEVGDMEQVYDDLLELSRPGMYISRIRDRAVYILLAQVGARRAEGQLVKCLLRWPSVELHIFLFTLLDILDPIRSPTTNTSAVKAYTSLISPEERHSLVPFIDFLKQLISSNSLNKPTISTALQTSLLDFLLRAYLIDFRDDLADSAPESFRSAAALQSACISLFLSFYENNKRSVTILSHAFKDILWPDQTPLQRNPARAYVELEKDWQFSAQDIVTKQLNVWRSQLKLKLQSRRREFVTWDVCADLIILAGSYTVETEVSIQALRLLYELILCPVLSTETHLATEHYLISKAEPDAVQIMSQIIRHLSRLSSQENREFDYYRVGWASPETDNRTHITLHFLRFFSNLAKLDGRCLRILLSANVLGLMRPLLELEMRGHPDFHMTIHHDEGDSALVYDDKDLTLLELIKSDGLNAVLRPSPRPEAVQHSLSRRAVLNHAFDVFLENGDATSP